MPNYTPIIYGINLSVSKTRFVTLIFAHILQSSYPIILLPFALKSSFAFEIQWQKALSDSLIRWQIAFSRMLPRNKKCAVTSNYCMMSWRTPSGIYKYRWVLWVCSSLGSTCGPCTACALCTRWDYKLTSLGASRGTTWLILVFNFFSWHFLTN